MAIQIKISLPFFFFFSFSLALLLGIFSSMTPDQQLLDQISALPGQPPMKFAQFSGYVTANDHHDREAAFDSAKKPLVLSHNGGFTDVAHVLVAKDGLGDFHSISEAVITAPNNSKVRYIIWIKGVYDEHVEVGTVKENITFVGDGIGKTIITGNRSVGGGTSRTMDTATVGNFKN